MCTYIKLCVNLLKMRGVIVKISWKDEKNCIQNNVMTHNLTLLMYCLGIHDLS